MRITAPSTVPDWSGKQHSALRLFLIHPWRPLPLVSLTLRRLPDRVLVVGKKRILCSHWFGYGFINILGVKVMKNMVPLNEPFEDEPSVS